MTYRTNRRQFLAGSVAAVGAAAVPIPSIAQSAPLKIGLLTQDRPDRCGYWRQPGWRQK